jgi:hypothetical protein
MLGNLSKVLIKAPLFFNNKTQIKRKNTLQKIPEENILDPFYQINHIKKRGYSLSKNYFKEKDFLKKNLKLDINFNNNKRLHKYDFHSVEMDLDKEQKEPNILFLDNNNSNKNDILNQNRRYFNFTSDNPIKTSKGRNKNVNIYKQIFLLEKDNNNLNDSDISLKSDERMRSFLNTENNNLKRDSSTFIKSYKNKYINTNEENININNSFENANNTKERNRLPKIPKTFKSQESLFQDNIDKRLISLISVKPKIKEQYKSINRNMVGQRDYFVYQKSGRFDSPNPFYESINKKEELLNNIKNKKNKK